MTKLLRSRSWRSKRAVARHFPADDAVALDLGLGHFLHRNHRAANGLEGVDHLIYGPREVWADLNVGELMSFEVIDDRGVSQIIKLRQPLMLPSPSPLIARE